MQSWGLIIYFQLHNHNLNNILPQTGVATDPLLHMKSKWVAFSKQVKEITEGFAEYILTKTT